MGAYRPRIVDRELDELLPSISAIALDGPKGVGKTATALERTVSQFRLDSAGSEARLRAEPTLVLTSDPPVLVDEWQRVPEVWDVIRRAVDEDPVPGRFLLTGSAAPTELPFHSGAGRILRLRMRPLSMAERRAGEEVVSLGALMEGGGAIHGSTPLVLNDYITEIFASGFPGIRSLPARARRAQLDSYLSRIIDRDFADQGLRVRRPATLRSWLAAYAAATGTTASYSAILRAASPGESDRPARNTTIGYRDVLEQLWMLDEVPAWNPRNHFARLGAVPKHFLADPALAARLLGLSERSFASTAGDTGPAPQQKTRLGALFEALVALSLQTYAQSIEANVHHLRTSKGDHEVDFIVSRSEHEVVGIEVKLAQTVRDQDVQHLRWLQEQLGDSLRDAVVVYAGEAAYRRRDGVAVVPLSLLGP